MAGADRPVDPAIYRLMVEQVRDYALFMLDPAGCVTTWNAGAQRLKGYAAGEIIGRHFSTFYTQEAIDRGWPPEELRLELSDRVRQDELFAFVEIPATALDETRATTIRYYSEEATYNDLRRWLREVVNDEIRGQRRPLYLRRAGGERRLQGRDGVRPRVGQCRGRQGAGLRGEEMALERANALGPRLGVHAFQRPRGRHGDVGV